MFKARGKSLYQWEKDYTPEFPLAEICGRVVMAMLAAYKSGVRPLVEHNGNVLAGVSVERVCVTVVDTDGFEPCDTGLVEEDVYTQMETVLINFDRLTFIPSWCHGLCHCCRVSLHATRLACHRVSLNGPQAR